MEDNIQTPPELQPINPQPVHIEKEEPVIETKSAPVYVGKHRFDSMEDLARFASERDSKAQRFEEAPEVSPTLQNANKPKPSDLMFSDPDAYHQLTIEEAESRIMNKISTKETEKKVWNDFYGKYTDLKDPDMQVLVEAQFNKRKNDMRDLPADQVLDTIGKEVRSLINKVRGKPEGGKELPSGAAVVASATNNIPPAKTVQKEPETMASALRNLQNKKRGR